MTSKNNDRKITIIICSFAIIFGIIFKFLPSYYYWHGHNFLKKENYTKARENFKKAYFFNKSNKDYRYFYAKSLVNLPADADVQKELFAIAVSDQEDSAQQTASDKISEWKNNLKINIGDNYIEQAPLDSGILRWDEKTFPLKVSIIDESRLALPAYYRIEILKAFAQWQSSTGFITFAITDNPKNANILVKISPTVQNECEEQNCKYVVGYTTPDYSGNLLKKMTIILYSKDPFGNFFSDKELYNTILHEIGHALGIMGHSYSTEDLMYMSSDSTSSFYAPYRSSFQYLSSKDINTIKLLYKLIPTITNTPVENFDTKGLVYAPIILGTSTEISSRKLKEAQNYIKNAPEIASGYIDLGIAYAELNKPGEAMRAMRKAYELSKSDNEKFLSAYNLAVMYMNSGHLEKAENMANEAKNISYNEDVKELLLNIKHAKNATKKPFHGSLKRISDE